MAMCRAYFDASGSPKEPKQRVLTVAGYVGTENKWCKFERDWSKVLAAEGIETFGMAAFAHFSEGFEDWDGNEPRRQAFIQALVRVLKRAAMHGFSVSIELDIYDEMNREYEFKERVGGPYGICAAAVANKCRKWMAANRPKDLTLYVFEKGDLNPGEVGEMMAEGGGNRFGHDPLFLAKQWVDEHGVKRFRRPFESCDFAAYESAHAVPLLETGRRGRGSALHLFQSIKHSHGLLNRTTLLRIARALRVPRRGTNRFIDRQDSA